MKKHYLLVLAAVLLTAVTVNAQITVTVTGNTNTTPGLLAAYPSLATALADLNAVTAMSGPVTLTLGAGTSETAPPKGLTIGSATLNPVLSATNTVTIVKAGGTVILNAGVGIATPSSASPDGILKLTGADYITIDGLTLADGNTTNPESMEFGIGMFKLSAADGCQNNTIKNCSINMRRVNNAAAGLPMLEGAVGIEVVNSTATAAVSALLPTAASGTNSNNKIYSNAINNGNYGIGFYGYAATVGVGPTPNAATFLGDLNNDIGGTSAATGNTILNYGGGTGGNPAAGIRMANQWSANISNNTINNNNGAGQNHNTTLRGIYAQSGTSANVTISNNTVTVKSGATGSALNAIENAIGGTAAGNTVTITGNTVQNCTYATGTSATFIAISNTAAAATANISSNSIQNNTFTGATTTGTFIGINNPAANTTTNINSNQILGNAIGTVGSANSATLFCVVSNGASTNLNVNSNIITNDSVLNSYGTIYALRAGALATSIDGNTVSGLYIPNNAGTGASTIYGYFASGTAAETVTNNTFSTFAISGTGTATTNSIYGIYNSTTTGAKNFSGNNINNFTYTSTGAGTSTAIGINQNGGSLVTISKNVIHTLSATGTAAIVAGLYLGVSTTATVNASNNIIGNLSTPQSIYPNLHGILCGSSASNINLYYNTVFLNGTSTGSGFGSTCIYAFSTVTTVTLRNNILVNLSTPTGTGISICFRRATNSLTTYGTASNNNLFYAGTASTTHLLYYDGTNSVQALSAYKTLVTPCESASVTETVSPTAGVYFQSLTGPATGTATNYLHIVAGHATAAKNGGATISGYTNDYDGDVRNATTPDIGADEFSGPPVVSSFTPTALCAGSTVTITGRGFTNATAVIIGGVAVTSFNVVSATSVTAVVNSSNNGTVAVTTPYGTGTSAGALAVYQTPSITGYSIACNQITVNTGAFAGPGSMEYSFDGGDSYGASATSATVAGGDTLYLVVVRNSAQPACAISTTVSTAVGNSTIAQATGTGSSNGNCTLADGSGYITIRNAAGNYIADVKDNANGTSLGNTPVTVTVDAAAGAFATGEKYLRRHFVITPSQATNNGADLKLYFTQADVADLAAAAGVSSATVLANLQVARFDGGAETPANNTSVISIMPTVTTYGGGIYSANFTTPGFSGFYPYYTLATPLPVALKYLSATNEGSQNKIVWHSATEDDLATYEVQRSKDGIGFDKMATVPATGKPDAYAVFDTAPYTGTTYYRLRLIANNGTATLSNAVTATMQSKDGFALQVHPNPFSDVLMIYVADATGNPRIQLTNAAGTVMAVTTVHNNAATLNTATLSPGVYFIRYTDGSHVQTVKVNKQ